MKKLSFLLIAAGLLTFSCQQADEATDTVVEDSVEVVEEAAEAVEEAVEAVEEAFKQFLVRVLGLGETTVDSMVPQSYTNIRVSKDGQGNVQWRIVPDENEPSDADVAGEDETDPIDETDALPEEVQSGMQGLNLNEMD